jgi:hypothetical protein
MPIYYIQAEAFNLDNVISDTYDISTIRGGSFMLLDAVKSLPTAIPALKSIATAASKGVFSYEDPGDLATQKRVMVQQVLRTLHNITQGHATFLVAVEKEIPNNFKLVLEHLDADVRRQQWRMPTVVVPPFENTDQECYFDGWRPGVVPLPFKIDPGVAGAKISAAADRRRKVGRDFKQHLFSQLLEGQTYEDDLVAKDLGKLAINDHKGILSGKIALIQVDGNSFGRIRSAVCDTDTKRTAFDDAIQKDCRNVFLSDVLKRARTDHDFRVMDDGKEALRIELLLWGGDEFTLIVPAWKGLEVLENFYRIAARLKFSDERYGDVPMTHRAAVIFCHHNAPILQIRRLANILLGMTRRNISDRFEAAFALDPALTGLTEEDRDRPHGWLSNPKYCNAARYLVLESFDMLRGSLEQFLERYYRMDDTSGMLLYANDMSKLRTNIQIIRAAVPKGRVVEIAKAISQGYGARKSELCKRLRESVALDKRDAVLAAIDILTKDNDAGWYLLADLWDFAEEWKA